MSGIQLGHAAFHPFGRPEGITPKHLRELGNLPQSPLTTEIEKLRIENRRMREVLKTIGDASNTSWLAEMARNFLAANP